MTTTLPNHDIGAACTAAAAAFAALSRLTPDHRAALLDAIATALDTRRSDILTTCAEETALTIEELTPEFARMTGTLRMFAALIREGSWVRAAIDTAVPTSGPNPAPNPNRNLPLPSSPIGPNHDLRSLLTPLGPVAVFGSSNFPLAYGVCGGDTASALAAGCPVIIKEHPAHPRTGRLLASIAQAPIKEAGFAEQLLGYLYNEDPSNFLIAKALVQNRHITAVGFTGSTQGGLALEHLARERHFPIPVYAEMGSLNTVFICPAAFARRGEQIADELAASVLARVGQQCTKPGAVFIAGNNEHWTLHKMICDRLHAPAPRRMLARSVADHYYRRLDIMAASDGILENTPLPTVEQREAMLGVPVVIAAGDIAMEDAPEVWEEIFGPAIIIARSVGSAPFELSGKLAISIYADPDDIDDSFRHPDGTEWVDYSDWSARVCSHGGRIIFNGPPTGVRVATSMVHGGPFPATNAPHTTAVGPRAIERFCRPICYQNCPDNLLPPELQNANPRNLWRTINGTLERPQATEIKLTP